MRYGHFDNERREYVIERVDVPVSWTNYIGVRDLAGVVNHTAGGYLFYRSPERHRVTRFRPNGVPLDRPGHYVYVRDEEGGEYWSLSWQPVGLPLDKAAYTCRHGLSYSTYECAYAGIEASQTLFIPIADPVEVWDVRLVNRSGRRRRLSVFAYAEFSFHEIGLDNQNFQMSLYAAGSSFDRGVMVNDPFYEDGNEEFFTEAGSPAADVTSADFDCVRDSFIGPYRTESNPLGVERGALSGSTQLGGNQCGALRRCLTLEPGEERRLVFLLGEGNREAALSYRARYSFAAVDSARLELREFWERKMAALQVETPHEGLNTLVNIWTLYQSEINVMFSRFASFIEVGGRTGLGYRDTAQDAMCVQHSNPAKCKARIIELLRGLTSAGYGLHLFEPEWFDGTVRREGRSPTVAPAFTKESLVTGLADVCADDALWLVTTVVEYVRETGDFAFLDERYTYADGGSGSVWEHLTKILDFSAVQVGENGVCKGLRADWNDCLNLGGGESAMVSFLHHWALGHFVSLARHLGRDADAAKYEALAARVRAVTESVLWNGSWYTRGITASGRRIGTPDCEEGKVFMESNTWAVISGAASGEHALAAMDAVDTWLYTRYGLLLNAPSYTRPDDEIGFATRVYPGVKENGAVFSHPNPWAWVAEAMLGRGERAMKFYDALCPYNQNDIIEIRKSEPYSTCQFIHGPDHALFGQANHPFMTGSGGWSYYAATKYILGIRPDFAALVIDPCIPPAWPGFKASRLWRGKRYHIEVDNSAHVSRGVRSVFLNGEALSGLAVPAEAGGEVNHVRAVMG